MCEFKVLARSFNSIEDVGSDIIYAKFNYGDVTLRDIIGNEKTVNSAIIDEVNVAKEQLKLFKHPIIKLLFNFLKKYEECLNTGVYSEELESLWEDVKSAGSNMVREIWLKLKGD
ncbi:MAG: hypothetical protein DRJ21_02065 [Candidatus Methanomethylicota archaeon]|uniref:CooT family nickel-binding protein n=1 Tax=Thermoproteota archaeon TaxID=2056631 RepID=A0A497ERS4_9CREN|nr:MAG: hypothetical protein DRJ21_02065 [Candidatus Verstraetearchaeota archaeon]